MKIGSLFSGYGGLEMGIRSVLGGETAWFSEIEAAPSKILAHHWPHIRNLGDITTIDWATVEPVDILTGGFPCQDVSLAGLRRGLHPDTRSGLWSHFALAIDALRPQLVIVENVRGLLSAPAASNLEPDPWDLGEPTRPDRPALRALGAVLGDLADLRYDTEWVSIRAADAGAPHKRTRIFITARMAATDPSRHRPDRHPQRDSEPQPRSTTSTDRVDIDRRVRPGTWGPYEPAIRRWETVTARVAPAPTEPGHRTDERLSPRFVEWMMGLPAGHVTNPAIGLTRNEQLKALGNGVVPQQAALALRTLIARQEVAA